MMRSWQGVLLLHFATRGGVVAVGTCQPNGGKSGVATQAELFMQSSDWWSFVSSSGAYSHGHYVDRSDSWMIKVSDGVVSFDGRINARFFGGEMCLAVETSDGTADPPTTGCSTFCMSPGVSESVDYYNSDSGDFDIGYRQDSYSYDLHFTVRQPGTTSPFPSKRLQCFGGVEWNGDSRPDANNNSETTSCEEGSRCVLFTFQTATSSPLLYRPMCEDELWIEPVPISVSSDTVDGWKEALNCDTLDGVYCGRHNLRIYKLDYSTWPFSSEYIGKWVTNCVRCCDQDFCNGLSVKGHQHVAAYVAIGVSCAVVLLIGLACLWKRCQTTQATPLLDSGAARPAL